MSNDYRIYALDSLVFATSEGEINYDDALKIVTIQSSEGAIDRIQELKYEYVMKTGKNPIVLVTWHKFYEKLIWEISTKMSTIHEQPIGFPREILGMQICLVPVPVTRVCGNADMDFTAFYNE